MLYHTLGMNQEYLNESHLDGGSETSEEPIQYTHQASAEMSSYGIRIKCKIQGFSIDSVTRELVSLYCCIEDQVRVKGIPIAPVQLKNGVKA
jgi:hypothetical protein